MIAQAAPRLFSVEEYHRMARAGILTDADRVELIAGEIVRMSPIGSRHAACVNRLNRLLVLRLEAAGEDAVVAVQNPVRPSEDSELQPDLSLLIPLPDFYAARHPRPADVLLLIEISDTSAAFDRQVKIPLYARHGVTEVWHLELEPATCTVYRRPSEKGYASARRAAAGESLSPLRLPELALRPEDLLA